MRKLYHRAGVMSIESEKKASETEHVLSARKKFGENGEFYFLIKIYPRNEKISEKKKQKYRPRDINGDFSQNKQYPDEDITATLSVAVENYAAEKQIIEEIGSVALRLQKQLPLDFQSFSEYKVE